MIAASRFEGGSWVRVGFLVTYAAFAYGCVVVGAATVRLHSFWRPDGPDPDSRDARIGWVARTFDSLRLPAAACLAGVLAGNLLIQRFTTRGSWVGYGLWCATAAGGVSLAAALGVRGRPEAHR